MRRAPFNRPRLLTVPERRDRGTSALELVLITPLVIVALMLLAGVGQVVLARQDIGHAAAAAARAASLTSRPADAVAAGRAAALDTLERAGLACVHADVRIDVTAFRPDGVVTATVTCTSDLSRLTPSGLPDQVTSSATSRAPLEPFRELTVTR